jgi:hypothetical protein
MITGIGCFAGPEKLSRIFLKMVQTYTLGPIDGIEWANDGESGATEVTQLLKTLMTGKAARQNPSLPAAADGLENKKITGFFLALKDHSLELSIFAKNGNRQRERHTAVLDGFSGVRQKRLN